MTHSNKGRKRPDLTLRNLTNNPAKHPSAAAKISAANKGKPGTRFGPPSEETKRKMREKARGRGKGVKKSPQHRANMAAAKKAWWATEKYYSQRLIEIEALIGLTQRENQ